MKLAESGSPPDGLLEKLSSDDRKGIYITAKTYETVTGVATKLHALGSADDRFVVKGPIGKGCNISASGAHVAFAGGTGVLVDPFSSVDEPGPGGPLLHPSDEVIGVFLVHPGDVGDPGVFCGTSLPVVGRLKDLRHDAGPPIPAVQPVSPAQEGTGLCCNRKITSGSVAAPAAMRMCGNTPGRTVRLVLPAPRTLRTISHSTI